LTFANYRETLRKPIVWTSVALFLVGTGMEAVAGQWSYSLLTITRRIGPSEAGICVASFWISLTAGRFAIGAIANRVRSGRLLQLGIALAGAGGILLSLDRGMVTALTALVVLGLGLAPLFPLLVSTTTDRVGVSHAANAVGFQVSGAYLGAALLPTLVGAMGNIYGLNVVGPFLVGAALCLYLLHQIVLFFGRQYASTLKLDSAGPTAVTSQA
jgi:fucose permease